MDPNVCLARIRELVITALDQADLSDKYDDDVEDVAALLAMSVNALDVWLTQGGFPPADWQGLP